MVMYFPLVDRFNNGDPSNDDPVGDERLLPLTDYMGGDLKGITKKIQDGYFKQLGINTIWLSPITQNPLSAFQEYIEPQRFFSGYHGYWPILSSKVDHRFGTEADLKELVDVAHENGMNVLLDYICNHVHEQHPMIQNNPDWATEFMLPDGRRNLRLWDEQRLTTWFDTFLPSLDLADSEVIDVQSDSALYWVKEFGLDGYRQDASKHVPLEFWRTLTRKLKDKVIIPQNRPIYQIGETYATNELIKTYISSGLLDAQFDFNLSGAAGRAIIQDENSLERVAAAMRSTKEIFGSHHSMGNLTGNHDQPRFMAYAGGDLQYDEDSREAGFNRKIVVKDEHGYQKLQTMTAFLMTIPGIPVIYYGDEIGMVGANDPDNRRMMRFDGLNNKEQETLNNARALAQLRKNNLVFTYGDLELLASSKDQLVYARNYFGRTAIIAISKGKNQTIEVDVPERFNLNNLKAFKEKSFSLQDRTLSLEVGKDDFQILYH
ncbi:MAG: alpha-amylase family glycosyl hydrolase, partial [Bacteroidota bacterium]